MLRIKRITLVKFTFQNESTISWNKKKPYESSLKMMKMLKLQKNLQLLDFGASNGTQRVVLL
jgi:uncharacterized Rossmann fold enzyme